MNDSNVKLINHYCLRYTLKTYDPYDIWKNGAGLKIKKIYYKNKFAGFIPAGIFYLGDILFNNILKTFYAPQEYPMVRALASLTLINCYEKTGNKKYLDYAKLHLNWLVQNYSSGYSGYCWGHNFKWVSKNGIYNQNIPYITITPYAIEAFVKYRKITKTGIFDNIIRSIFSFIENDLLKKKNNNKFLALSYAPIDEPRIVINANSYALYSYLILLDFFPKKKKDILNKVNRLYNFIVENQNINGSWFYFADKLPGNFIDCFHTCFILKNLIKSSRLQADIIDPSVIHKGVLYLQENFFDKNTGLYKRFSITDAPSFLKFDLYDNAEMMNLFFILGKKDNYRNLNKHINTRFLNGIDIFSKIDILKRKVNKNNLRWAAMPYLYALSCQI